MENNKRKILENLKYLKILLYPIIIAGCIGLAFLTNGALENIATARTPIPSPTSTQTPPGGVCAVQESRFTGFTYVGRIPIAQYTNVTVNVPCANLTATPTLTPRSSGK